MDDKTITALAREYAEEYYKIRGGVDLMAGEAENVIRFLLRRYCLVKKWEDPKTEPPEIRERVLICEKHPANQYKVFIGKRVPYPCPDGWEWNQSTKDSVVAWMPLPKYPPDLGKEAEG